MRWGDNIENNNRESNDLRWDELRIRIRTELMGNDGTHRFKEIYLLSCGERRRRKGEDFFFTSCCCGAEANDGSSISAYIIESVYYLRQSVVHLQLNNWIARGVPLFCSHSLSVERIVEHWCFSQLFVENSRGESSPPSLLFELFYFYKHQQHLDKKTNIVHTWWSFNYVSNRYTFQQVKYSY